jgi:hypothetical protein
MPPKIVTGEQFDESRSRTEILTGDQSNLEVTMGNQHGHSERVLKVNSLYPTTTLEPPPPSSQAHLGEGSGVWARGSFFIVAFLAVGAVIGTLAYKLKWYLVPVSIIGSILVLYLLALVLLPGSRLSEKGFLSVLTSYVRLAFAIHPGSKRDSQR